MKTLSPLTISRENSAPSFPPPAHAGAVTAPYGSSHTTSAAGNSLSQPRSGSVDGGSFGLIGEPADSRGIDSPATRGRTEVSRASALDRSSSLSPQSSCRLIRNPLGLLSCSLTDGSSAPETFGFDSNAYLMSIRGGKVKTSPRQGGNGSLSVPNSPQIQRGAVSPPVVVPPRLRTHRRTVSALANVIMTTPSGSKDPEPPSQRKDPLKAHNNGLLRRLKSLSGGILVTGENEQEINSSCSTQVYRLDPRSVAEELTVLDGEMLRRVKPQELRNGAWMKKEKEQCSPNVMGLIHWFNRLALLVTTEVLEEDSPQTRGKVITSYINVADKLYHMHNFNSLQAVLSGLQSASVYRLCKSWATVGTRKRRLFDQLCAIMSSENNWKLYREVLGQALLKPPCVPFLGQFLTDTAQCQTSQKHFSSPEPARKSSTSSSQSKKPLLTSTPSRDGDDDADDDEEEEGTGGGGGEETAAIVMRGSSEQLRNGSVPSSPKPPHSRKYHQPRTLFIRSPNPRRRHSIPTSEGNSLGTSPSPSSSSSHRWSFDKSDSGLSGHSSLSCPDLLSSHGDGRGGFPYGRAIHYRRSSSNKALYFGPSFLPIYQQYIGSGSSQSLDELGRSATTAATDRSRNGRAAASGEDTGSNVALALEQFSRIIPLNGLHCCKPLQDPGTGGGGGGGGETDTTATTSSRLNSSYSSLEELLSVDDDDDDVDGPDEGEDRVFRSREHTPGSQVDHPPHPARSPASLSRHPHHRGGSSSGVHGSRRKATAGSAELISSSTAAVLGRQSTSSPPPYTSTPTAAAALQASRKKTVSADLISALAGLQQSEPGPTATAPVVVTTSSSSTVVNSSESAATLVSSSGELTLRRRSTTYSGGKATTATTATRMTKRLSEIDLDLSDITVSLSAVGVDTPTSTTSTTTVAAANRSTPGEGPGPVEGSTIGNGEVTPNGGGRSSPGGVTPGGNGGNPGIALLESPSPFKSGRHSTRFSSFREKARTSLRGLKLSSRRRRHKHGSSKQDPAPSGPRDPSPYLLAAHLDVGEALRTLQVASMGYCGSCGPHVAVRQLLLVARCHSEDQNFRRSKLVEPLHDPVNTS